MRRIWVVTNGEKFAGIGFTWSTALYRNNAKPYFSRWRARVRAWRMNRADRDFVAYYLPERKHWYVEEVETR